MRKEKAVVTLLNNLTKLLAEETARNPDFAERLGALLYPAEPPARTNRPRAESKDLPDAYAEYAARGESEFRLWLRDQQIDVLRALVRRHDLDATRKSAKWKDPEKLSEFIADQIRSRRARGSGFLSGGQSAE